MGNANACCASEDTIRVADKVTYDPNRLQKLKKPKRERKDTCKLSYS